MWRHRRRIEIAFAPRAATRALESALAFLLVLCVAGSHGAYAWGDEGHEMVATIALRYLSPVARADVTGAAGMSIMRLLQYSEAQAFAREWIAAWNSRDLDRVLSHYEDDFEFSSPFIVDIAGEPSGTLRGKAAIRDYWTVALARNPDLRFELANVYSGVRTLVIQYRRHDGGLASEWFELGDEGKVIRSAAQYAER